MNKLSEQKYYFSTISGGAHHLFFIREMFSRNALRINRVCVYVSLYWIIFLYTQPKAS